MRYLTLLASILLISWGVWIFGSHRPDIIELSNLHICASLSDTDVISCQAEASKKGESSLSDGWLGYSCWSYFRDTIFTSCDE
jgi:hypothetical protein